VCAKSADADTSPRIWTVADDDHAVDTAMVEAMDPGGRAKAIVHSSGRLYTVDEIAEAAVALVGSRRVVRTVPGWRGALIRSGSVFPSQTGGGFAAFEAVGRRVMRRR